MAMDTMDSFTEEKVMLYIDNSNIFNETQKFSARKKKFLNGVKDVNCRLDIGNLVNEAIRQRDIIHGKLYGSEPPALDTVWRAIRQEKIEVYYTRRSVHNFREKQTDTGLVNAATKDIILKQSVAGDYRSVILFTGDSDMLPVVMTALEFGWRVEIWSYRSSLAKEYIEERTKRGALISIYLIDQFFEKLTFQEINWPRAIPVERSLVLKYKEPISTRNQKKNLTEVINKAIKVFQLPFMGKYLQDANEESSKNLVLIPCCAEKKPKDDSNEKYQIYDFNKHIWERKAYFESLVNCKVITFIDFQDQMKHYDFAWIIEVEDIKDGSHNNDDNSSNAMSDPDLYDSAEADGFKTILPKKSKTYQKYSDYCRFGYTCKKGNQCTYAHRDTERDFFKAYPKANRALYKSKPCKHYANKQCKYEMERKTYLCPFVHDHTEIRCLSCKKIGVHWTDECDIPRDEKGIREYYIKQRK